MMANDVLIERGGLRFETSRMFEVYGTQTKFGCAIRY